MKKTIIPSMLILSLVFFGCSQGKVDVDEDAETGQQIVNEEVREPTTEDKPEVVKEEEIKSDYYFDGVTAEIQDVKIKIIDTKVIPVGDKGNEYGDVPVFALWYEVTNKSDKEIDASVAWIAIFSMIQDNDENMVNELDVGMLPDESHLDTQLNVIKKDGTVENSISYELDDEVTPVTLIATRGIGGEELGRFDYKITE